MLYGRGDFDRIDYRLVEDGQRGIEFVVSEKPWGPNYPAVRRRPFLGHAGRQQLRPAHRPQAQLAQCAGRAVDQRPQSGRRRRATRPSSTSRSRSRRHCSRPRTRASATRRWISSSRAPKSPNTGVLTDRVGVDLGYALGTWGELRIGPQYVHQRAYPTVALPGFPVTRTDAWGVAALARADTQDNAFFPHRGLRGFVTAFVRHTARGQRRPQRHARRDRLPPVAAASVRRHRQPRGCAPPEPTLKGAIVDNYRLGGFLELSGLRDGGAAGPVPRQGARRLLHRMGHLPVIGNTYYAGGSLEIGNVWPNRDAISARTPSRRAAYSSPPTRRSARSTSRGATRRAAIRRGTSSSGDHERRRPSQGANCSRSGGTARSAEGVLMSAAGPRVRS